MTNHDDGFAGLPELVVALLLLGLFMPLLGVGLDNTWQLFGSLTGRAAADSSDIVFLSAAESDLQGAQPLGYCATPNTSASANPAAPIEAPMPACSATALGPVPPDGADDWSAFVSPLPVPSPSSCGAAELGAGALVVATATCIGFFSYDNEASGSPSATVGALSDTGPFTPPDLDFLWQCMGSCEGPGGTAGLWLTTYLPTGGYTNAGCPSPASSCTDPDWSTATVSQRFVGTLATTAVSPFGYRDAAGESVAKNDDLTPPAVAAADLPAVELVSIEADVSPSGSTSASATLVALTGNVYQSSTNGNG